MSSSLTTIEAALLLAAYFRGNLPTQKGWISSCDQVITLSLFYTGDITFDDCAYRFSDRSHVLSVYEDEDCEEVSHVIRKRYGALIQFLRKRPDLIRGGGDFELPAHPMYTACRLTQAGEELIPELIQQFPTKPDFPNWPDKRSFPNTAD